jgi:hypothetical protein
MSETIVLRGVPVELEGAIGHAFVVDATRAAEGLIDDAQLMETYELTAEDLRTLAANKTLARAIQAERTRRVRTGLAARESASGYFIKAPKVLDSIMMDEQANARHRIEAVRELRQTAIPENQNAPSQSDRFIITINLGADCVETYNKSIAINPNDPEELPKSTAPERPKLTVISNDDER